MNNTEVYCQLLRASHVITHYLPHNGVVHLICSARRQHGFAWDSRPVRRISSAGSPVLGVVVSGGRAIPKLSSQDWGCRRSLSSGTEAPLEMSGLPLRKMPETTAQGNMSIFLKQSPGCILLRRRIWGVGNTSQLKLWPFCSLDLFTVNHQAPDSLLYQWSWLPVSPPYFGDFLKYL